MYASSISTFLLYAQIRSLSPACWVFCFFFSFSVQVLEWLVCVSFFFRGMEHRRPLQLFWLSGSRVPNSVRPAPWSVPRLCIKCRAWWVVGLVYRSRWHSFFARYVVLRRGSFSVYHYIVPGIIITEFAYGTGCGSIFVLRTPFLFIPCAANCNCCIERTKTH